MVWGLEGDIEGGSGSRGSVKGSGGSRRGSWHLENAVLVRIFSNLTTWRGDMGHKLYFSR